MGPSSIRVAARYMGATSYRQRVGGDDWFVVWDVVSDYEMVGWRIDSDGKATIETYRDEYDWEESFEEEFEEEYPTDVDAAVSPRVKMQIDALISRGKPITEWNTVWHITSNGSASSILSGGFKAQPTKKGRGVSVSVSLPAARGLLTTLQRMNSFRSHDAVEDWYRKRGVEDDELAKVRRRFDERPPRYGNTPAALYLRMMSRFHPAVGGSARIPYNEFLWSDIGSHLIGESIVAVEALYGGPVPSFGANAIEAELFLRSNDLDRLAPERVRSSL